MRYRLNYWLSSEAVSRFLKCAWANRRVIWNVYFFSVSISGYRTRNYRDAIRYVIPNSWYSVFRTGYKPCGSQPLVSPGAVKHPDRRIFLRVKCVCAVLALRHQPVRPSAICTAPPAHQPSSLSNNHRDILNQEQKYSAHSPCHENYQIPTTSQIIFSSLGPSNICCSSVTKKKFGTPPAPLTGHHFRGPERRSKLSALGLGPAQKAR